MPPAPLPPATLPPLEEVETFSKPGTADVTPEDRKKLAPIINKYRAAAHPFGECKRDQLRHGLSEDHANRRCAVVKALGMREAAEERLREIASVIGAARLAELVLEPGVPEDPAERGLKEEATWYAAAAEAGALAERDPINKPGMGLRRTGGGSTRVKQHTRRTKTGVSTVGSYLRTGSTGRAVRIVQKAVGVKADGKFNRRTKRAVRQYQKKEGLKVDGVVGAQTISSIRGGKPAAPGAFRPRDQKFLSRPKKKLKERLEEVRVSGYTYRRDGDTIIVPAYSREGIAAAFHDILNRSTPSKKVRMPNGLEVTAGRTHGADAPDVIQFSGGKTGQQDRSYYTDAIGLAAEDAISEDKARGPERDATGRAVARSLSPKDKPSTPRPHNLPPVDVAAERRKIDERVEKGQLTPAQAHQLLQDLYDAAARRKKKGGGGRRSGSRSRNPFPDPTKLPDAVDELGMGSHPLIRGAPVTHAEDEAPGLPPLR